MVRLTNAASIGVPACMVQYATKPPFNADNTKILVLEVANFALYEVATQTRIGPLEWLGDSNSPLWSKTDPDLFYYCSGNRFMSYNVKSGEKKSLHIFTEYSQISDLGEGDLGEGDHIALCGTAPSNTSPELFVYTISANRKGSIALAGDGLDAIYITPDGNVITSRPEGCSLFDNEMRYVRQLTHLAGHKDVMRDTDGAEIMVITDNMDNDVKKIRLADASSSVILQPLPWEFAVNISCPDKGGFAIISTYGKDVAGEILRVPLAFGQQPISLGQHGSSAKDYESQPRAAVSCDGKWVAFNSDKEGKVDVYLLQLDSVAEPVEPSPISADIFYADARGGGKLSHMGFDNKGRLVKSENLD